MSDTVGLLIVLACCVGMACNATTWWKLAIPALLGGATVLALLGGGR